jgi:hypothetical protein
MQHQRILIPSFRARLMAAAATLTLFLPAAICTDFIAPAAAWEKFRPWESTAAALPRDEIHEAPVRKTKGSLALQTAAIVGSSSAVAAAKAANHKTPSIAVRRLLHWR